MHVLNMNFLDVGMNSTCLFI